MLSRVLSILILIFGALVAPTKIVTLIALFIAWKVVSVKFQYSYWYPFLLSMVAAPLLLGEPTVMLAVPALWVIGSDAESRKHGTMWASPWILMVLLWTILSYWNTFDSGHLALSLAQGNTFGAAIKYTSPDFFSALEELCRITIFVMMVSVGATRWQPVIKGTPLALGFVIIVSLLQKLGLSTVAVSPFWNSLNRIASSFSDPNAFGIGMFILLIFCLALLINATQERHRGLLRISSTQKIHAILLIAGVICALWSGSRTFVLGLLAFSVAILIKKFHVVKNVVGWSVLAAIFAAFIILLPSQYLPQSLVRARALCTYGEANDSCSSRILFSRISYEQFLNSPEIGLGPNSFERTITHFATKLGYNFGTWVDSGNNFYAQFLAEYGLLGIVSLLLSFTRLSFRGEGVGEVTTTSTEALRIGAITFFCLLVVGSHTDFPEIATLAGILTGSALIPRKIGLEPRSIPLMILSVPLLILGSFHVSYGLYPFEKEADGSSQRWLAPRARFTYLCDEAAKIKEQSLLPLVLRNATPQPTTLLVRELSSGYAEELVIDSGAEVALPLQRVCVPPRHQVTFETEVMSIPWSPGSSASTDKRVFGVRLKGNPALIE